MKSYLEHGDRRFQTLAYHDAIRHDGPALELAEMTDGEVGPELLTVLFSPTDGGEAEVVLTDGSLPLSVLTGFLAEAVREQRRLGEQPSQDPDGLELAGKPDIRGAWQTFRNGR